MSLLPDLARQLHLPQLTPLYQPHGHDSYHQSYVTPGTVDPEVPSEITSADTPDTSHGEKRLEEVRAFNHILDKLFEVVHRPGYEVAGPFTIGGKSQVSLAQVANVTGTGSIYTIASPFDCDGEYCCIAANFGAAGQAVLSKDPTAIGPSLTSTYDGTSLSRTLPFFASGVAAFTYGSDYWFPLQASDSLFWAVNMATPNTSSALVTVAFRRRINRHGRYFLTQE